MEEENEKKHHAKRAKVGLALGSGGARGLAHIGILQVLEEHDIPIDYIAGSSMGALIGSLYAVGHTPHLIKQFTSYFPQKYWLDYGVPRMGFIKGDKIKEIIRLLTKNQNIEDTEIPLAIVATNLSKGERTVFTKGSIAEAVRASSSIPGIFVPEKIGEDYYVDGGVIDRVPVSIVKEMGADVVIAVDVSNFESSHPVRSIFDVIAQSIDVMEREIFRYRMIDADILIRPDVGNYSVHEFSAAQDLILAGENAAHEIVSQIKDLISEGRESTS